jgi:hypothetical protein
MTHGIIAYNHHLTRSVIIVTGFADEGLSGLPPTVRVLASFQWFVPICGEVRSLFLHCYHGNMCAGPGPSRTMKKQLHSSAGPGLARARSCESLPENRLATVRSDQLSNRRLEQFAMSRPSLGFHDFDHRAHPIFITMVKMPMNLAFINKINISFDPLFGTAAIRSEFFWFASFRADFSLIKV